MERNELREYLAQLLVPAGFRDYCPNGLQVEGRSQIRRIVCGVTACQALLDAAVTVNADAVLVHHGYFWKGEDGCVTGYRKIRLATLLANDINLFAYHLPLDAHPEFGNNAQLALRMGWDVEGQFGEQNIGFFGGHGKSGNAQDVAGLLRSVLQREVMLVGNPQRVIKRIAWCTGGAQGYFEAAIAAGADIFVSGELSEQTTHLARESGVPFIAAGHHATERYGVQALAVHLAEKFGIQQQYVDIDNPA